MARIHGKDVDFSFDTTAMEGVLRSVTMNFSVPSADITSFSDTWQNSLAGKPTATIDTDGFYQAAEDLVIFGELGLEAEAYDFEPDGSLGYSGFAIVTSYSITAPVDGAVTFTASYQHNGGSAAADGLAPSRG